MEAAAIIIGANTALAVVIYLIVSRIWQDFDETKIVERKERRASK